MTASVLIVGAGFAGLGTAIRLRRAGVDDFVILERAGEVGGTWRDNTYPGAACDIPSPLYSFSFAQHGGWTRAYARGPEILDYLRSLVERFDLRRHIRFSADVARLAYADDAATWTAHTTDGRTFTARVAVVASGPLANASLPEIRGLDTYRGHVMHSARWDHDYDLTGKRVAVIGTGASAVQIVPELVRVARKVTVFQRTPGWVLPRPDHAHPGWLRARSRRPAAWHAYRRALFWAHEVMALALVWDGVFTTALQGVARAYLRRSVRDRWLRRQLTPDHRIGCKRLLLSSDYLPALQRDNCTLITWPIARLAPHGIRTADGVEHRVDCVVFATGFEVGRTGTPYPITGRGGRMLADEWRRGARAYKSVSVAGFPNLFLTFGPNSGPGHNSVLVYNEAQIDYIVRAVTLLRSRGLRRLDVRADAQEAYNADLQRRLARTTWNSGCRSWYLTEDGHNVTMYPGFATQYVRQLATVDLADYEAE